VGALAAALMLVAPFTARTPSRWTGIVLLDMARIARYDIAAPVFGLGALLAYLGAKEGEASPLRFGLAGFLAALAGLSHLHGLFWIVALAVLALWDRVDRRGAWGLALGFAAPWLAYGLYVLGGWQDWRGQTREYAPRFSLLDPAWYLANLAGEWRRYTPGPSLGPGWLGVAVLWPASAVALARQWRQRAARALLVPALILPGGFALLIQSKLSNYLIAIVPLGAPVVAWGGLRLWRWAGTTRPRAWLRVVLAALLAGSAAEAVGRFAYGETLARATTPYAEFIARVRAEIPDGARVLGLHNYWLGLDDLDYRAWPVPLWQADPAHWSPPLSIEEALDGVAPDAILIDPRMRAFFNEAAGGGPHPAVSWMEARGFTLAAVVEDRTYGQMEIYLAP
jgi:hypothetical protein